MFIQKDRYTQHVAKQHAEAATSAADAPPAAAPAAVSAAAPAPVRVTHRVPKTILQEFLQKAKRLAPRYTPRLTDGGLWTCKVVLPDRFKPDSDVVLFMEEGADDKEEAQQRAAVVALARVATHLPLQRLLSHEYKERFLAEETRERERQERARVSAEAAARRRAASERPREKLSSVYMSDDKRRLVEAALAAMRLEGCDAGAGEEGSESDGEEAAVADAEAERRRTALQPRLLSLGFHCDDVAAALGRPRARTLNAALDWLVTTLPEERLPRRFAAASGEPIGIVRLAATSAAAALRVDAAADGPSSDVEEADEAPASCPPELAFLVRRGYAPAEARAALLTAGCDAQSALRCLFGRLLRAEAAGGADWPDWPAAAPPDAPPPDGDAWADECLALCAIFGEDATVGEAGQCVEVAVRGRHACVQGELTLALWASPLLPGGAYPHAPPLLSVHGAGLPRRAARQLTAALAQAALAAAARGEPCCHSLASDLPDMLASLPGACFLDAPSEQSDCGALSDDEDAAAQAPPVSFAAAAPAPASRAAARKPVSAPSRSEKDGARRSAPRGDAAVARESAALSAALATYVRASGGAAASMRAARARLPASEARQAVVTAVSQHRVLVLSGETGCGKSTQVPQFILEAAAASGAGGACSIVCTQPRRISAIGLAERVSAERCEPVGSVVGYAVRLESRRSEHTRLLFCTTGILLRRLLNDPQLQDVSHVVLDEVHERSLESDLLLLLLRELLARRPTLRLVLMSATADANLFVRYFEAPPGARASGAPFQCQVATCHIPGFTHPVADYYLEDCLERTGFLVGKASAYARRRKPTPGIVDAETGEVVPAVFAQAGEEEAEVDDAQPGKPQAEQQEDVKEDPAAPQVVPESWDDGAESAVKLRRAEAPVPTDGPQQSSACAPAAAARARADAEALAEHALLQYSDGTRRSIANVDEEIINYQLIEQLVAYILNTELNHGSDALVAPPIGGAKPDTDPKRPGAVLVFLPGVAEIGKAQRALERSRLLLSELVGPLWILALHGALSAADQRRVFEAPPSGVRKIVLATNVAETSVTIDDVRHVIDTGRVKEMCYDAARGLSRLEEGWASAASGRQRRGRAGRTAPGAAYRLFSRRTAAALPAQGAPEMLRVPLEALCLRVKALVDGRVADTLARALTPPPPAAVAAALAQLRALRALDPEEGLTPLGLCLVRMPVDARLAKMLVYGAMLGCLDPVLTVAGALSGRGLFVTPRDPALRAAADAAKAHLASSAGKSDHLTAVRAYDGWRAAVRAGRSAERAYIDAHSLSWQGLDACRASRDDFAAVLADLGFVGRAYVERVRREEAVDSRAHAADAHSHSIRVVKAALCAGLYPNVVRVRHPEQTFAATGGGAVAKEAAAHTLRFFAREAGRVFLHPASVNFGCGAFDSPWLVYSEAVQTAKVYIRECTMVPPYALLLFGGEIVASLERGTLSLDGWAEFEAPARVAVLVRELRQGIDRLLAAKVANPQLDLSASPAVTALLALIGSDGF